MLEHSISSLYVKLFVHETFRLLPKLNINVVLKRNYERKLSSSTGHFEMQLNFLIERTSLVCYWIHSP